MRGETPVASTTLASAAPLAVASFSTYPNPSAGNFTLALSAATPQAATLVLSDLLGRVVYQRQLRLQAGPNEVAVEVPGQQPGLYQLSLRTADGQRYGQRLAIRP